MSELKELRIHIGNVSSKLHDNSSLLEQRLSKYATSVISPLEFHTKPLQLHYFAYVTISITQQNYEKLKSALNGVVFMGSKLSVSIAKPSYTARLEEQATKNKASVNLRKVAKKLEKEVKIAQARARRIEESQCTYPTNSFTLGIRISDRLPIHDRFSLSEHTANNTTANTKNPPPTHRLDGTKSYGATTGSLVYKYKDGNSASVIKGVHRRTPRKDLKLQTLRILINGELKTYKCYKTKLWGVERGRSLRELTWKYEDGIGWKSGDDHLVESVSCGINGRQAMEYGKRVAMVDAHTGKGPSNSESYSKGFHSLDEDNDAKKNKLVLAAFLQTFDFDKPVDVEEEASFEKDDIEVDSKGRRKVQHYDYEIKDSINDTDMDVDENENENESENESENEKGQENKELKDIDIEQVIKQSTVDLEKPKEETYYDEDDEGNDILDLEFIEKAAFVSQGDIPTNLERQTKADSGVELGTSATQNVGLIVKEKVDLNEEQLESKSSEVEPTPKLDTSLKKQSSQTTEALRSLFNPTVSIATDVILNADEDELARATTTDTTTTTTTTTTTKTTTGGGFKLALSDDDEDLDTEKVFPIVQNQQQNDNNQNSNNQDHAFNTQIQSQLNNQKTSHFGLFWPHLDSPFLSTQSHLAKIGAVEDDYKYTWPMTQNGQIGPNSPNGDVSKIPSTSGNGNDDKQVEVGEETEYEKWFWSVRGEITRECKRRRRDLVRNFRKRK